MECGWDGWKQRQVPVDAPKACFVSYPSPLRRAPLAPPGRYELVRTWRHFHGLDFGLAWKAGCLLAFREEIIRQRAMLPELTASGKENASAAAAAASSAAEDGGATGKRRRVEPGQTTVKHESNAGASADAESGEGCETYGSIEEATSSANFWKTQYYALHRQKDEKGFEQKLHTLKELSESRETQLKKYMFDVERRLKEAKDELAEIKKADAIPVPPGDILDAFPSATDSPMADANTNNNDGKAEAKAEAETKGGDEVEATTTASANDTKHEEEINQMKEEMDELSSAVKTMQQIISHYKMLTSVKLINVQSDSFDVQIRNFQRSACATFRLTHLRSGKDDESSAAELRLDPVDGAKYLPEFMRNPIEFGVDQCPSLLREALATMFAEENER